MYVYIYIYIYILRDYTKLYDLMIRYYTKLYAVCEADLDEGDEGKEPRLWQSGVQRLGIHGPCTFLL